MSLRTRLVIGVVALLALGLLMANLAAVMLISSYQRQRIDQQLEGPFGEAAGKGVAASTSVELCRLMEQTGNGAQLPTSFVFAVVDRDGSVRCQVPAQPSATGGPDLTRVADRLAPSAASQQPSTVPGLDHRAPWRVKIVATSDGYVVIGISLADAIDTLRRLQLITLVVSVIILALGGFGSWFMVRLALRPLTTIEHTAQAIADGDLSQRIDETPATTQANTEIGRLTRSLNRMLSQIEQGFADKIRTEERLRRFIADASHELRTPLASIRGHAEMYRHGVASGPREVAVIMDRIESESRRMGDLVNDLLLLARLDAAPDLLHRPVDLLTVAADTVLDARAREPGRPVTVSQVHGEGWVDAAPVVSGDESRIRQVLGNVVANVLRHTPAGTPYEVMIGVREDTVEARVIDHGPGLSAEEAARVFERFYRSDYGRARSQGGAGLGLSIAAGLMAAHGGAIAHSETPGGGSTFTLTFPTEQRSVPDDA
jgi:two-component system, OmpR family, sensor kinase